MVGTFSPTPSGLGAVEGVLIALLVGFGLRRVAAVAIVLVYRLIFFWLPIPVGLGTYLRPCARRLPRVRASPCACGTVLVTFRLAGRARRTVGGPPSRRRSSTSSSSPSSCWRCTCCCRSWWTPRQTLKYISQASYFLLGAARRAEIAALAGYANLFRYILRVLDIRLRLGEVWAVTLSSLAVSHILSAGGVGGWVVSYNALMKHKVPHGIIFVAIAAQQFFNYVVLWFFFALAIVYLIVTRGGDSIFGYLVGIVLIVLLLWLTLYGVYLYNHPTRLRRRARQTGTHS